MPDAHFLDPETPVKSGVLNFAKDASLRIDVDSVVLRLAGVDAPQLFAITWPKAIAPKANARANAVPHLHPPDEQGQPLR